MRSYFIDATREILKGEGLKALSVRTIAERAGYSYATMYHYFKDIRELIFLCVQDFQAECTAYVQEETKDIVRGDDLLKGCSIAFMKYFIQYPGIFELFYLEKMNAIGGQKDIAVSIHGFHDRLCEEGWKRWVDENKSGRQEVERMQARLKYAVTGMLLFYLNRRQPENWEEMHSRMHAVVEDCLSALS